MGLDAKAGLRVAVLRRAGQLVSRPGWKAAYGQAVADACETVVDAVTRQGGGTGCLGLVCGGERLAVFVGARNVRDGGGPPEFCLVLTPEDVADVPAEIRAGIEPYLRRPELWPQPRPDGPGVGP
jgi:hypothetical protein